MLTSLLKKCTSMKHLKSIHARILKHGKGTNRFLLGKIILFCAVSDHGDMSYASSVFGKIPNPDEFLWSTMIRGFGRSNEHEEAFEYYKRMQYKGIVVNNFTLSYLLKSCGQLRAILLGKQLHCCAVKLGLDSHLFVRNTMIHLYGLFGDIEMATELFEEMPKRNLVVWNTMLDCYVNCRKCKEALDMFLHVMHMGIEPDEATFVVTLSACSQLGALDFGKRVHDFIGRSGFSSVVSVSNALIDMYAKCGAVREALETFFNMDKRNILSWNTMIMGLATNRHADEAIELFAKLLAEKLERPDGVTFLGVLCACSHGGMVEQGREYFKIMSIDYRIEPTLRHYGCMVDMLGRAGFLKEAYELITSMPIKCNAIIWRSLLAACHIHGDVELGEIARRNLLDLEPDYSSDYILLSSMYASTGQWNRVFNVRRTMHLRRVEKPEPGNSSIGVCSTIFLQNDSSAAFEEAIVST